MDPISRRGLAEAGAAAVIGLAATVVPTAAHEVGPTLPEHWERLLALLGTHDAAHGAHHVLGTARRELRLITAHPQVARGGLRSALMRAGGRWASTRPVVRGHRRTALLERALHLAREADHPDLIAWSRARQAQWSDPSRASVSPRTVCRRREPALTRALYAVRAAHAHARLRNVKATERMLAQAHRLATDHSASPPLAESRPLTVHVPACWEARCWAALEPATGVALYDSVLRDWPRGHRPDAGLYLARLACAGDLDRARAEGRKAFALAQPTQSSVTTRELKQLTSIWVADRYRAGGCVLEMSIAV